MLHNSMWVEPTDLQLGVGKTAESSNVEDVNWLRIDINGNNEVISVTSVEATIIQAVQRSRGIGVSAVATLAKPLVSQKPKPKPQPKPNPTSILTTHPSPSQGSWSVAKASQYGGSDGFYYHHFACGGTYLPGVIGVAHKSIPCGTTITFLYHGNQVNMKVIDRGPYCCGRSWDFTVQAAKLLGFNGIGTVYWRFANK